MKIVEKYKTIINEIKESHNKFLIVNIDEYIKNIEKNQKNIINNINKNKNKIELTNEDKIFGELFKLSMYSLNILQIIVKKDVENIINENMELFIKKNKDYGDSFKDFELIGILVRLNDKINRIKTINNTKSINIDEKMEETINDLYNYCVIGLMYK